jgi:predicted amidohydrolase YtcJ
MNADLVLLNANIITMNPKNPHAEAIAIKKDRIIKVGKSIDIPPFINKSTEVLDLNGKTVLPGFIDTHIHIADFGRTLNWLDLKNADSIQAIQETIKQKAQTTPKNKWILGSGWNQNNLKEKRPPTRQDLDETAPNNPVILYHQLGRTCTTNTKALKKANITQNTPNPKNGTIDKNPQTNQPTGILHGNATDLIWNKIPRPNQQETLESTKRHPKNHRSRNNHRTLDHLHKKRTHHRQKTHPTKPAPKNLHHNHRKPLRNPPKRKSHNPKNQRRPHLHRWLPRLTNCSPRQTIH